MRLHDYLEYWSLATPEKVCVSDGEQSYTYAAMNAWADRIAAVLPRIGIGDGTRFGVLAANCPEWIAIYYGAFKCGAVPVPLNYRLHPSEWKFLLTDSTAAAVLVQDQYVDRIATVRDDLPGVREWLVIDGARPSWGCLPAMVAATEPDSDPSARIDEDHDCWQMYTSGTTGLPKGAVLTHRSVHVNMLQSHLDPPTRAEDTALLVMPMYHVGAAIGTVSNIAVGSTIRVMAKFDPVECVRVLETEGISRATFVPAMIQSMLVNAPGITDRDFSRLRLISYGASPISAQTLRQALDVFGCEFRQAFGQTETSGSLTCLTPRDHRRVLAGEEHLLLSCGRALPGTEIAIVDPAGKPVPTGEPGEIIARGPQMMRGYWNKPEATAATLVDGWLHTGDIGRLDAEKYVYISDRVKDMVVSGGENIYPREIENVLFAMPALVDAAVIGVPDPQWGERVKAVVVARDGCAVTEQQVIEWCRTHLASYKAPASVDFVAELPRNPSGKVLKTMLREPYWKDVARRVG
jgi:acyl-CoA synthetase (AMP-forming)/AMP-acid ligase II